MSYGSVAGEAAKMQETHLSAEQLQGHCLGGQIPSDSHWMSCAQKVSSTRTLPVHC